MKSTNNQPLNNLKIAIVHDDFIQKGGAEKLIYEITREFVCRGSKVVVYSSLISPEWKKILNQEKILYEESFLKFFPGCYKFSKFFFFFDLFHLSFQNSNFDKFDLVFSSSTRYGHSVLTKPKTFHISYVNSPPRAVWFPRSYFLNNPLFLYIIKNLLQGERLKDYRNHQYSDLVLTNSENIYKKYFKIYKRQSLILNPFVDKPSINEIKEQKNYYVLISRLVSWKKIDYVIEAFNQLGFDLYIIGEGPNLNFLKSKSQKNINFLGYISNDLRDEYLSQSKALIFPQEEDFGLTIIESLSYGVPIIYFNKGGAKNILNSDFGTPYESQDALSLTKAVSINSTQFFDRNKLIEASKKYSKKAFFDFLERIILNKLKL